MADGGILRPAQSRNAKPKGGLRRGAGRPVGSATKRSREVANRLVEAHTTPLETMVRAYLWFDNEAARWRHELDALPPDAKPRARMKLAERIKGYTLLAHACAKDAAPYVHPRLQAAWIRQESEARTTIILEPGDERI